MPQSALARAGWVGIERELFGWQVKLYHSPLCSCRVEGLQELGEVGIHIMQLDVTSSESVNKAVQKVLTDNGRIDLLVCNAGAPPPPPPPPGPFIVPLQENSYILLIQRSFPTTYNF
jgi:NAD(P)-dependent dehydrogenase (short-subunit alcohol dehydrogenase family)